MSLRKRLARVEQTLANVEERKGWASCICKELTLAIPGHAQELEAEMNQTCPVHGIIRLGRIMHIRFGPPKRAPASDQEDAVQTEDEELDEVLERYHARLAAAEADSSFSDR